LSGDRPRLAAAAVIVSRHRFPLCGINCTCSRPVQQAVRYGRFDPAVVYVFAKNPLQNRSSILDSDDKLH
ncbi:MAG: hypothetical protein LBH00_05420, partial [Planctomycetaceae bacterium]|nr:hypothetical protein [Planctomycetaceae bacterium]